MGGGQLARAREHAWGRLGADQEHAFGAVARKRLQQAIVSYGGRPWRVDELRLDTFAGGALGRDQVQYRQGDKGSSTHVCLLPAKGPRTKGSLTWRWEAELSIAMSTSVWMPHLGERFACKSELVSAWLTTCSISLYLQYPLYNP